MALQITTNINVDFYENRYIIVNAKQYDDMSRLISVTCYNQGEIFNLNADKHTAYIKYRKADGRWVLNSCSINRKGQILIELTEQMLAASGICYVDIFVVDKGSAIVNYDTGSITTIDSSSVLTTKAFYIDVQEAVVDNSLIESVDDYDGLTGLLERAEADYQDVILGAKSYAIGTNNQARENDEKDNSKYYSQISKSYAMGGTSLRTGENTDNSKYYSEQAHNSADAADESEANALSYMNTAKSHKDAAETAQSAAETAQSKSEEAQSKAEVAQAAAETAERNSEVAQNKAETAQNVSETAQQKAETAQQGAEAAQSAAEIAQQKAETAQNAAETAENNAKQEALQAAQNAVNNVTSLMNEYVTASQEAATSAESSKQSALTSETNAKSSEQNAQQYMDVAKVSETNSLNSELNAKASEDSALISANKAQSYAVGNTGTRDDEDVDNARYYYEWIKNIVNGLDTGFIPMGTVSFSELASVEKITGYVYNISDDFITDGTFREGEGRSYTAGTNVYCTASGEWDCLGGSVFPTATVSEVKDYLGI